MRNWLLIFFFGFPAFGVTSVNEFPEAYYQGILRESPSEEAQIIYFKKWHETADQWVQTHPKDKVAQFWRFAFLGELAKLKKNLWALGALRDMKAGLTALYRNDPHYGYGASCRLLGKIYQHAPRWVSIGSMSGAKDCFQKTLKDYPKFPGNQLAWLLWLIEDEDFAAAGQYLSQVEQSVATWSKDWGDFSREKALWEKDLFKAKKLIRGAGS